MHDLDSHYFGSDIDSQYGLLKKVVVEFELDLGCSYVGSDCIESLSGLQVVVQVVPEFEDQNRF